METDSLMIEELREEAILRVKDLAELEIFISLLISPPKIGTISNCCIFRKC